MTFLGVIASVVLGVVIGVFWERSSDIGVIDRFVMRDQKHFERWKAYCVIMGVDPYRREKRLPPRPAIWVTCDHCYEHWCRRHKKHVCQCECPPAREWEFSPYEARL